MGDVIHMTDWLADRARPRAHTHAAFFFDLGCPFSYLAAERVERLLEDVAWVPVVGLKTPTDLASRVAAERRATELRLPLVWPDRFPPRSRAASRAAVRAGQLGAGAQFSLAAARLAFCGGFDLEDPEVLAEAAAAARIPLEQCLEAAKDCSLDATLDATGRGLLARGVTRLPAVRIGRGLFSGEGRLAEAAAARCAAAGYGGPLVPVA
jgi:2-hydroxychromene-2-carboxylate isomerase